MYTLVSSGSDPPAPFRPFLLVVSFFLLLFLLTCTVILSGLTDLTVTAPPFTASTPLPASSSLSSSLPSLPPFTAIIDAGSAGSRIYLYEHHWRQGRVRVWIARDAANAPIEFKAREHRHSLLRSVAVVFPADVLPPVLSRVCAQLEPGLSFYSAAGNHSQAAASLEPLLLFVAAKLALKGATLPVPLLLFATAGLRSLAPSLQAATLSAAVARVQSLHSRAFALPAESARVISGKEEGLFAWLALNYALGHLDARRPSSTAGLVELGGASVQVAFEMTPAIRATLREGGEEGGGEEEPLPAEYAATVHLHLRCTQPPSASLLPPPSLSASRALEFGSPPLSPSSAMAPTDDGAATVHLYVATYLGYGANAARSRHVNALVAEGATEDPCLPSGAQQQMGQVGHSLRATAAAPSLQPRTPPLHSSTAVADAHRSVRSLGCVSLRALPVCPARWWWWAVVCTPSVALAWCLC